VLTKIAGGSYTDSEVAAFLTVFMMRSITVEELTGFRDAMLNLCIRIDLKDFNTIDVCGTGGDGKDTFNISTLSTFILAGAGVKVAKHGNYGVTSICGSSNILEYFGYKFSIDQNKLYREIEKSGVCFMHAPLFNPAMKNIVPIRRALKIKTFFNMLGPMINPSSPKNQFIGVYSLDLARLYNYLYQLSDVKYAIVHSLDGYDEVSLTSEFKYIDNGVEDIMSPADLGYEMTNSRELLGGTSVKEAAEIFTGVLTAKESTTRTNIVIANSLLALRCLFPSKTIAECKTIAEESLFCGKAYQSFKQLIEMQP
jgi:anthranilate phosphoribosyltransferase